MKNQADDIKIGRVGIISGGGSAGWYLLIQDDGSNTGGYLILTSKAKDFSGEGFDNWVPDLQSL